MTSIATITAAIPAAVALGPGAEVRQAMAVAIIGGVFVSTLLTLFVVPCVYSVLSRRRTRGTYPEVPVQNRRGPSDTAGAYR